MPKKLDVGKSLKDYTRTVPKNGFDAIAKRAGAAKVFKPGKSFRSYTSQAYTKVKRDYQKPIKFTG